MRSSLRVIWQAQRADTGRVVSFPYYTGAAARLAAARESRDNGGRVVVTRDGRLWTTYAYGAETTPTDDERRTDWDALAREPRTAKGEQ